MTAAKDFSPAESALQAPCVREFYAGKMFFHRVYDHKLNNSVAQRPEKCWKSTGNVWHMVGVKEHCRGFSVTYILQRSNVIWKKSFENSCLYYV